MWFAPSRRFHFQIEFFLFIFFFISYSCKHLFIFTSRSLRLIAQSFKIFGSDWILINQSTNNLVALIRPASCSGISISITFLITVWICKRFELSMIQSIGKKFAINFYSFHIWNVFSSPPPRFHYTADIIIHRQLSRHQFYWIDDFWSYVARIQFHATNRMDCSIVWAFARFTEWALQIYRIQMFWAPVINDTIIYNSAQLALQSDKLSVLSI